MAKTPSLYAHDQKPARMVEETKLIQAQIDHDALVVKILANGMVHEHLLLDIESQILRNLNHPGRSLVLDCTEMTQAVSSRFLGVLIKLQKTVKAGGGRIGICGLTGNLREAFTMMALQRVIPVYDSRREALLELGEYNAWEKAGIESVRKLDQRPATDAEYGVWLTTKSVSIGIGIVFVLGASLGLLLTNLPFFSSKKSNRRPPPIRESLASEGLHAGMRQPAP